MRRAASVRNVVSLGLLCVKQGEYSDFCDIPWATFLDSPARCMRDCLASLAQDESDGARNQRTELARPGVHPLKSTTRAYNVGGTSCVQPFRDVVFRVPDGFCPPLQVSVVHWV